MRILFCLLFIICVERSLAQRVFYTRQDVDRSDNQRSIVAIYPHWIAGNFASKITVTYKDGAKQKINRDSIWGFESNEHILYRCFQGGIYKIEQVDDLLMYVNTISRYADIRYGRTLDSPLYITKREARKDTTTE